MTQTISSQQTLSEIQQLKAVNHHLRIAADQVSEGIMILEPEPTVGTGPRIVYVNKALCKITRRPMEELLGHSLSLLFEADKLSGFLTRLPAVAQAGRMFHTIAGLNCADGSNHDFRWTVRAVNDRIGAVLANGALFSLLMKLPLVGVMFAPVMASIGAVLATLKKEENLQTLDRPGAPQHLLR